MTSGITSGADTVAGEHGLAAEAAEAHQRHGAERAQHQRDGGR